MSFPFFCTNHSGQEVGRQKKQQKGKTKKERWMPRSGHVPRAHGGLAAGHLESKGYRDSGPKLTGKPGGWEDLSVPSWGSVRTRGAVGMERGEWAGAGEARMRKLRLLDTG